MLDITPLITITGCGCDSACVLLHRKSCVQLLRALCLVDLSQYVAATSLTGRSTQCEHWQCRSLHFSRVTCTVARAVTGTQCVGALQYLLHGCRGSSQATGRRLVGCLCPCTSTCPSPAAHSMGVRSHPPPGATPTSIIMQEHVASPDHDTAMTPPHS